MQGNDRGIERGEELRSHGGESNEHPASILALATPKQQAVALQPIERAGHVAASQGDVTESWS